MTRARIIAVLAIAVYASIFLLLAGGILSAEADCGQAMFCNPQVNP